MLRSENLCFLLALHQLYSAATLEDSILLKIRVVRSLGVSPPCCVVSGKKESEQQSDQKYGLTLNY